MKEELEMRELEEGDEMLESPRKRLKLDIVTSHLERMSINATNENDLNEDNDLGFQVTKGLFLPEEIDSHALVLSQGWPSWSFALEGLGFASISTMASFPSITSRDEFRATTIGASLLDRSKLVQWIKNHESKGILFIQGNQDYFETITKVIGDWSTTRIVFACSDMNFFTAEGWRESHANAGGITNGEWTCFVNKLSLGAADAYPVRRTLRHVLRTTEGASSMRLINKMNNVPLTPNKRVIWGAKHSTVCTYSVFDKSGPVVRFITLDELLDIYDIELLTQGELKRFWKRNDIKPTRAFVEQIPVKVLRALASRVTKALLKPVGHTDSNSVMSEDSNATQRINNVIANEEITATSDCDTDDESLANELVGDVTEEVKVQDDKAACDDDKEADARDWDEWMVDNFTSEMDGQVGLICNKNYDPINHDRLFESFRSMLIRRYRKNVCLSLLKYLKKEYYPGQHVDVWIPCIKKHIKMPRWTVINRRVKKKRNKKLEEMVKDIEAGRDAVRRSSNAQWWSWDEGSTLFYWRWPGRCKASVRDGTKLFVDWNNLPSYWKRQKWPEDELASKKLKKKLSNVRSKAYVQPGFVKSLTSYFAVPKAKTDIRVVYDATACGLNNSLWAPNFFLPTVDSILRNASSSTWFGDIDLGEMFLNYPLDEAVRPYAGVDVTGLGMSDEVYNKVKRIIERWVRCLMGFKPSPYITTQTFAWGEEVIIGDRSDPLNPFFWDLVILNLPGTTDYLPDKPWVFKWNSKKKEMASFFGTYIDDIRGGGSTELACRQAIHRTACRVNYLGQQDAPRKRGQATQTPRAWAGAKCMSIPGKGLFVLCMKEKWDKTKIKLGRLIEHVITQEKSLLDFKSLERDVGFLCHISRTYPSMFPYLKGFYNTLNNWRCGRDRDGWKYSKTAWLELIAGDVAFEDEHDIDMSFENRKRNFIKRNKIDQPDSVSAVPRLKKDLMALSELFKSDNPELRLIRGVEVNCALFGFGDASGGGFGSSWEANPGTKYRLGTWGKDMDGESSNFREFTNLVETLEEMGEDGTLEGKEIFLFTDNSTSEAAYYSGSSSSEKLFNLVLRVKKLEMTKLAKIHIIHVAGERMKEQGSDGLSRGNLNVGVMAGKRMLDFVPIHISPLQRSPTLKPWLMSFLGSEAEFLDATGWFTRGHDLDESEWEYNIDGMKLPCVKTGTFVWTPPPCAALSAVEELRKARHKRQRSHHLFVVPRLMEPMWRKQLYKAADLVVSLKPGHDAWPRNMHEPLTIAFLFPFISQKPWQLRGSIQLLALGRSLCRVWAGDEGNEGLILRQLWSYQRRLENMPAKLASKMLQREQIDGVLDCLPRKRRRREMEKEEGGDQIFKRQKR